MTLTDAGPLVALLDADERDHKRCIKALDGVRLPLITTWPAFTEAMYLIGRALGWTGQEALWRLVLRDELIVAALAASAIKRSRRLMETYADHPMDLADATLVALAEERNLLKIFTLDSHFRTYRLKGRRHFEIIPA